MEEKFYKTDISLKGKKFVILTPVNDIEGLFACTENLDYLILFGDIKSFMRLACIFAVLCREKI